MDDFTYINKSSATSRLRRCYTAHHCRSSEDNRSAFNGFSRFIPGYASIGLYDDLIIENMKQCYSSS